MSSWSCLVAITCLGTKQELTRCGRQSQVPAAGDCTLLATQRRGGKTHAPYSSVREGVHPEPPCSSSAIMRSKLSILFSATSCRPPSTRKILHRTPGFRILISMTKLCELCGLLRAELASARMETTAIHRDHAVHVADSGVASPEYAAWFKGAMMRWVIAASNLEFHWADHVR
jgi:hypothetical protein